MNELYLRSNLVCIEKSRPLVLFGFVSQKYCNSDFQSHFLMSKINEIFLNFFFIEEYEKGSPTCIIDILIFDFKCT